MNDQHIPDAPVVPAQAPVSGVSVPRHMGVGSDLTHSLDYVVMLQVMFNVASRSKCTPTIVGQQLQERGIRSAKNADELVGKNAVFESFARLIAAGYIRRTRAPHPTKPGRLGPMVYEVFDNPAWNPDWTPEGEGHEKVKPQVGTRPGTPDVEFREEDKTAGQNTSRNAGRGISTSGVPGRGIKGVSAGQNTSPVPGRGIASPPHPPGEVTTSPPIPPTDTTGRGPAAPEGEGEGVSDSGKTALPERFTRDDLRAASHFLQRLPDPWTQGRPNAERLAPDLLEAMDSQGWPSIHEVDARLLAAHVGARPVRVTNPYRLLLKDRIPNLPLFRTVSGSGIPAQGSGTGPGPVPGVDPDYKPVPPPADVAAILAGLRKPGI